MTHTTIFNILTNLFGETDIEKNKVFQSETFDFFVISKNLFIDVRTDKLHGGKSFSPKYGIHKKYFDIEKLNALRSNPTDENEKIIEQWTKIDPKRRDFATKNKLNYLEIFDSQNLTNEWIAKEVTRATTGLTLNAVYSEFNLLQEVVSIENMPGILSLHSYQNKNVYEFQPYFYSRENEVWLRDKQHRRMIIENAMLFYNKTRKESIDNLNPEHSLTDKILLMRYKIAMKMSYGHFNPRLVKYCVDNFLFGKNSKIYMPCVGWGHKLLVSRVVESIEANDNSPSVVKGLNNLVAFHDFKNIRIEEADAISYVQKDENNCAFVCPPYNNIEIYEKCKFDSETQFNRWLLDLIRNCFSKESVQKVVIVIASRFVDLIKSEYPNIEFEHSFGTTRKDHFNNKTKVSTESLLIINR